MYQQANS